LNAKTETVTKPQPATRNKQLLLQTFLVFTLPTPIFAANFRRDMRFCFVKCLLVAAFSLFSGFIFAQGQPGEARKPKNESFNANEVIFGHVLDAHEFHFFLIKMATVKNMRQPFPCR
jgi:hypothetical protein